MPLRPREPLQPEFDSIPGTILSERSFLHEKPSDAAFIHFCFRRRAAQYFRRRAAGRCADLFFSNLRLDDLFFSGGLISLSFTFVPMLFFRMIKVGVQTGIKMYQQFARCLV